jgi:hypothetical protein
MLILTLKTFVQNNTCNNVSVSIYLNIASIVGLYPIEPGLSKQYGCTGDPGI